MMNTISSFRSSKFRRICKNWIDKYSLLFNKDGPCEFHRSKSFATFEDTKPNVEPPSEKNNIVKDGPNLSSFIDNVVCKHSSTPVNNSLCFGSSDRIESQSVYFDVRGCQMNVNDTEVVWSILKSQGYRRCLDMKDADIILLMTCAIRESAEEKIWNTLDLLSGLKKKKNNLKIGLLGCMAERLKEKILDKRNCVDVIAGPDSYKDLPRLLATTSKDHGAAVNVILSLEETYADITPVRLNPNSVSAFVTIMRGCDNMCTYCIVPFTRGRERSRPIASIINEIKQLSDEGVKEVTLLGQNVNSYRDTSISDYYTGGKTVRDEPTRLSEGFKTVYKSKKGGLRFSDLLDKVSLINPEMRIRFTSPHPKDFPNEVLELISARSNICNQLHLPAQSGNDAVLQRMRRGYTREAYLNLVDRVRSIIPDVSLSSDFIAGFCGETESEFQDTISLIRHVKYNSAFLFSYSMREKTTAHRRFEDNVPSGEKLKRLQRMIAVYRSEVHNINRMQIGQQQLVLIDGTSKRSSEDFQGRNDGNIRVILPRASVPVNKYNSNTKPIEVGDYVVVHICNSTSQSLTGIPLYHSSIADFYSNPSSEQRQYVNII